MNGSEWSAEEDALLRRLRGVEGRSYKAIAAALPARSANSLRARARNLGLAAEAGAPAKPWSAEDDRVLRARLEAEPHRRKQALIAAAAYLGRPERHARSRAAELGLLDGPPPPWNGRPWSTEEDAALQALLAGKKPGAHWAREAARALGRSRHAVKARAEYLGIFGEGQAERRAEARARRTQRPCLCCGKPFLSEGIGDRLCDPCGADGDGPMELSANALRADGRGLGWAA